MGREKGILLCVCPFMKYLQPRGDIFSAKCMSSE